MLDPSSSSIVKMPLVPLDAVTSKLTQSFFRPSNSDCVSTLAVVVALPLKTVLAGIRVITSTTPSADAVSVLSFATTPVNSHAETQEAH